MKLPALTKESVEIFGLTCLRVVIRPENYVMRPRVRDDEPGCGGRHLPHWAGRRVVAASLLAKNVCAQVPTAPAGNAVIHNKHPCMHISTRMHANAHIMESDDNCRIASLHMYHII